MQKIERLHIVDMYRGLLILGMVVYHLFFDLEYLYNLRFDWFHSYGFEMLANFIRFSFIFLVGISSRIILINSLDLQSYRKKQISRFNVLLFWALVITFVTILLNVDPVYFGILHLVAFVLLFFVSITNYWYFLIFLFGNILAYFWVDFWGVVLGISPRNISMLDFFPIYPWIIPALIGYFSFPFLYRKFKNFKIVSIPFLEYIGKNSLKVYLLHQPIILAILFLIYKN